MNLVNSVLVAIIILLSGCQKNIDDYAYRSEYLQTEGAGFTLVKKSLTYDLLLSEVKDIPEGTVAVITFENTEPCKEPVTIEVPVRFEQFLTLERKIFSVSSPVFTSAKANVALTVSVWLSHNGKAIGHHMERVKLKFSEQEFREFGVIPTTQCITSASNPLAARAATPQSGAH